MPLAASSTMAAATSPAAAAVALWLDENCLRAAEDAASTDAGRQGATPALMPPGARLAASGTTVAMSPPALALASRPDENRLCAATDVASLDARRRGTTTTVTSPAAWPRASPRVPQRRGGGVPRPCDVPT